MMLEELAVSIHEERSRKWASDRNAMAQRRSAAGLGSSHNTPGMAASFGRSGRELARVLRRGHGSPVAPESGAR